MRHCDFHREGGFLSGMEEGFVQGTRYGPNRILKVEASTTFSNVDKSSRALFSLA